jgi:hypothetical protein
MITSLKIKTVTIRFMPAIRPKTFSNGIWTSRILMNRKPNGGSGGKKTNGESDSKASGGGLSKNISALQKALSVVIFTLLIILFSFPSANEYNLSF